MQKQFCQYANLTSLPYVLQTNVVPVADFQYLGKGLLKLARGIVVDHRENLCGFASPLAIQPRRSVHTVRHGNLLLFWCSSLPR